MEWVEVTGKSVEEAKEVALDKLGVAEADAELVVVDEPKTGLFGRLRSEARVRARVRPVGPRPKRAHRQRERGRASGSRTKGDRARSEKGGRSPAGPESRTDAGGGPTTEPGSAEATPPANGGRAGMGTARRRRGSRSPGIDHDNRTVSDSSDSGVGTGSRQPVPEREGSPDGARKRAAKEESTVADGISLQEQGAVAKEFLEGLLERYRLEASVEVREIDEETVELAAFGDGLGMLVGPKGATLAALQDVTRTVVQRRFPNRTDRILVDVAGYRERRVAALRRFSQQVASEVVDSGSERALEPMSPADRKVIHDTVVEIDGVTSRSEGEDPNRYVVIAPAG